MTLWEKVQHDLRDKNLHLIPKVDGRWDTKAVLAKLHELGITP